MYHPCITQVSHEYHLKLPNDFKEGEMMAIVSPKPPTTLAEMGVFTLCRAIYSDGALEIQVTV